MLHVIIRHRNQPFLGSHHYRSLRLKKKRMLSFPSVFCYFPVPLAIENLNTNISVYKNLCQLRTCPDSLEKKGPAPAFLGTQAKYQIHSYADKSSFSITSWKPGTSEMLGPVLIYQ